MSNYVREACDVARNVTIYFRIAYNICIPRNATVEMFRGGAWSSVVEQCWWKLYATSRFLAARDWFCLFSLGNLPSGPSPWAET